MTIERPSNYASIDHERKSKEIHTNCRQKEKKCETGIPCSGKEEGLDHQNTMPTVTTRFKYLPRRHHRMKNSPTVS